MMRGGGGGSSNLGLFDEIWAIALCLHAELNSFKFLFDFHEGLVNQSFF